MLKAQKIIPSAAWQRAPFFFFFWGMQLYQYLPNSGTLNASLRDDECYCCNIAEMCITLSQRSCTFSRPTQQSAGSGLHHYRSNLVAEDKPTAVTLDFMPGNYRADAVRCPHSAHVSSFSTNSLLKQTINSFNLLCQGNNGPWHWCILLGWPMLRAIL